MIMVRSMILSRRMQQLLQSLYRPERDSTTRWYLDRTARALILFRYLPAMALLNLAWEAAHVRLYTIWTERSTGYVAFAVAHCTLGDLVLGGAFFALALILTRAGEAAGWRWSWIAVLTVVLGIVYTGFSEWLNTEVFGYWQYREIMPVVRVFDTAIGVSPLLQWLVLPPLALFFARSGVGRNPDLH